MATYFTLIEHDGSAWHAQFGDYDRATVVDEMGDILNSAGHVGSRKVNVRIITSGDTQSEIDAAIAAYNSKPGGARE